MGIYISCGILITLGVFLHFTSLWYKNSFGDVGFDAVLFTLFTGVEGANTNVVGEFLLQSVLPTLLIGGGVMGILILSEKLIQKVRILSKTPWIPLAALVLAFSVFLSLGWGAVVRASLDKYIAARLDSTDLFDKEYVDPNGVEIQFPEEKRNLIYIYLESMENTFLSQEKGGALTENMIPQLETLAEENLNFSHTEGLGGGRTTTGSTWTIAAMISQSSGTPLCLPNGIWNNGLNHYSQVLPGLTTITDILHKNGYNQTLMVGSDASFGGRREYFTQHGMDRVYDLFTAREEGIVPEDYWNDFWGFEDLYLFEYAKEKITEIASTEQPFAFTMLTVDTHHPQGYHCYFCPENHEEQFENVLTCSSLQVLNFVQWIQQQEFYENTTVIITGDHYSMNATYTDAHVAEDYVRRVYNCFINVPVEAKQSKNREFVTLDMFPTTLAAMGCKIEGNRLGLGTNLFSEERTLTEKYGFDYLCAEINKASPYYETNFLYGK